MPITASKAKAASVARKTKAASAGQNAEAGKNNADAAVTRQAIDEAVQRYMAENFGRLMAESTLASGPELEAMFAEIDRNLEASEQCIARVLAARE